MEGPVIPDQSKVLFKILYAPKVSIIQLTWGSSHLLCCRYDMLKLFETGKSHMALLTLGSHVSTWNQHMYWNMIINLIESLFSRTSQYPSHGR